MRHRVFAERAYHASCELSYLNSLLTAMIDQLERLDGLLDPAKEACIIADEARIACHYVTSIADSLSKLDHGSSETIAA